jgi:hypothetical protein
MAGTVRGILATDADGRAHGHLAIASKDGARRYRALTGSEGPDATISIQLEQICADPGIVELASIDVHVLGESHYAGGGQDADIVLSRLPDATHLLRATVLADIDREG